LEIDWGGIEQPSQKKSESIPMKENQVTVAHPIMHVGTRLPAKLRIFVVRTVCVNQFSTVNSAASATTFVLILLKKYALADSNHHMSVMDAASITSAPLRRQFMTRLMHISPSPKIFPSQEAESCLMRKRLRG
jgi:hypothetical protein